VGLNTSDSEGFSNVILEYMAAGKPVIATNVGGNKELVVDNVTGFLTPKGDENSLAEKIIMLLLNEKLRTEMGKKSREIIKLKCDWKYKIKEVESYYEHLMEIKN
jgi:glycosyltransferase involved in cell wall biosynthesis